MIRIPQVGERVAFTYGGVNMHIESEGVVEWVSDDEKPREVHCTVRDDRGERWCVFAMECQRIESEDAE